MQSSSVGSIASQVIERCVGADSFTLGGGYAVLRDGRRALFPPARPLEERRNVQGRCTYFIGMYEDGSRIRFTFSESQGPKLNVVLDA